MSGIWITGTGAVGPMGRGFPESIQRAPPGSFCGVPEGLPLKEGFPSGGLRWLDCSSLWWLNAAKQALEGGDRSRETAQVVGLGWGSTPPVLSLIEQVRDHGFSAMTPALFPYSVGNAPAAQAGILLKLRGAAVTLCAKEAAGLAAVVEASRLLDAGLFEACVAGGVDQLDPFLRKVLRPFRRGAGMPAGEGAYALMLERSETAPEKALAHIVGWSARSTSCVPHRFPEGTRLLTDTVDALLDRAGWDGRDVDLCVLPADTPGLREVSACTTAMRLPAAKPLAFQRALGACGASWAGAAALAARELASGRSRRAVLVALATGGCAWGLALEASHVQ